MEESARGEVLQAKVVRNKRKKEGRVREWGRLNQNKKDHRTMINQLSGN